MAEADVQAYENSPAILLAWGSTNISPPEDRGSVLFMLSVESHKVVPISFRRSLIKSCPHHLDLGAMIFFSTMI